MCNKRLAALLPPECRGYNKPIGGIVGRKLFRQRLKLFLICRKCCTKFRQQVSHFCGMMADDLTRNANGFSRSIFATESDIKKSLA